MTRYENEPAVPEQLTDCRKNSFVGVNIGCGATPTEGWINLDNSPSLILARHPTLLWFARWLRVLSPAQLGYVRFAQGAEVRRADASRHIPLPDSSADVVYASHLIAFFDSMQLARFLGEVRRVLKVGGILRLVEVDLDILVNAYLQHRDGMRFLTGALLSPIPLETMSLRLRFLLFGRDGRHRSMYNAAALCAVLRSDGFQQVTELSAGETMIPSPGALNLNERKHESFYIEAVR